MPSHPRASLPVKCVIVTYSRVNVVFVPSDPTVPPMIPPLERRNRKRPSGPTANSMPARPATSSAAEMSRPRLPAISARTARSTRASSASVSGRGAFTRLRTDGPQPWAPGAETARTLTRDRINQLLPRSTMISKVVRHHDAAFSNAEMRGSDPGVRPRGQTLELSA